MNAAHQLSTWFPARGRMQVSDEKARKKQHEPKGFGWRVVSAETGKILAFAPSKAVALRVCSVLRRGTAMIATKEQYETMGKARTKNR